MARKVKVTCEDSGTIILQEAIVANTFLLRLKGLLGQKELPADTGLIIKPCKAVHTLGMSFAIDVAFVDKDHTICAITKAMSPNKLGRTISNAHYVIEAPEGTFARKNLWIGAKINLETI